MQINNELYVSYQILKGVYLNQEYVNISLNKVLSEVKNKNLNTSFVTKLIYGVIEKDITLDYFLQKFLKGKTKTQIIILFKMGAYLKHFMSSMPDFAIVNELVNLSKKIGYTNISGFVNATLKNLMLSNITFPENESSVEYLSIRYSYPMWIISKLIKDYGLTETVNILSYELPNQTNIRVNTNLITKSEFISLLDKMNIEFSENIIENTFIINYETLMKCDALKGLYFVQGIPSIIVANNIKISGGQILDVCAAPGGKTVLVATNNLESNVIACDIHEHRLKLIENYKNIAQLKNIILKQLDATIFSPEFESKFEFVLCDVPCSGTGVISKKPDILLNKQEGNIENLNKIQLAILNNSSKYVKTNGELIYSTCSILKQENENVIEKFLNKNTNFKLVEVNSFDVPTLEFNKTKTFLPHISNTEGFFIGRMKKI